MCKKNYNILCWLLQYNSEYAGRAFRKIDYNGVCRAAGCAKHFYIVLSWGS